MQSLGRLFSKATACICMYRYSEGDEAMESVTVSHAISATYRSFLKPKPTNPFLVMSTSFCSQWQPWRSHFLPTIRSQQSQSDFLDFQDYAKPSRLLQAAEMKVFNDNWEEKVFVSHSNDVSCSLYKVKLGTSHFSGSSLSNMNAGVLLCLIDENGDSILQRISASSVRDCSTDSNDDLIHFQRGSVDEFTFEGPKLGRVRALWIGLESGQWRLDGVSLTVIFKCQPSLQEKNEDEEEKYICVEYKFQAEDVHLGEGSDISMLELRPSLVTELYAADPSTLYNRSLPESMLSSQQISNEESMREYADLKFSLLLYDAVLISIGTSAASFSAGESAAFAFLTGGIGGFLYLLLLQRSVDGLSAPESSSQSMGIIDQVSGGSKGPISSVALAIGFVLFIVKFSSGDSSVAFTPQDLILGMIGFLACKVAVILAALKPVPKGLKINK